MNIIKRLLALVVTLALFTFISSGQSAAEIAAAKAMAKQYGYSESEINSVLNNKVGQNNANPSNSVYGKTIQRSDTEQNLSKNDSTLIFKNPSNKNKIESINVYGFELFQNNLMNFIPSYNIPTPKSYKFAVGDQLIIDIWGAVVMNYTLEISPEGSISIPDIGPVYILGKTAVGTEKYLRSKLSTIYSGLSSDKPNTFLKVSLGKMSSITINVVGDVRNPGAYSVPSLSTVLSALYQAGGPSKIGSLRNIKIFRNSKIISTFDLYDFIFNGDYKKNLRLEDNDMIRVCPYENRVSISGNIKRPMIYELKDDETLEDVLNYCGGFTADANKDRIYVVRKKGKQISSIDIPFEDFNNFKLKDGDSLNTFNNIQEIKNSVNISGPIWHGGDYAISDTLNDMKHLLELADVKENVYLNRAYIKREDENRHPISFHFSVKNVLKGIENIKLQNKDSIILFSTEKFITPSDVVIIGYVNKPVTTKFRDGITVGDMITLADGFKIGAASSRVSIARRVMDLEDDQAVIDTITILIRLDLKNNTDDWNFKLKPYDVISVRKSPSYVEPFFVKVTGQVAFPGIYYENTKEVRISTIIKRAGGIDKYAYVPGVTLSRKLNKQEKNRLAVAKEMVKNQTDIDSTMIDAIDINSSYNVGVDLQAALSNPGSYADIVLREGDIINVPLINNTVRISGGVLYENVVPFNPKYNLYDYIDQAGGYLKGAIKRKTYAVYANGTVVTKRSRRFKIEPGCEIVVPRKDINKSKMSTAEIMAMANSSTSIAAMVVSIVNILSK
ncbi:MAG: SLBB domain-containing protein [Bacteroidales bacterium]